MSLPLAAIFIKVIPILTVIEVGQRIGGGRRIVDVDSNGVRIEGASTPNDLPVSGGTSRPSDVDIGVGDSGCQTLRRNAVGAGGVHGVDGTGRGFVDGVNHGAAAIINPDGDLFVITARGPYKGDGDAGSDSNESGVESTDFHTAIIGIEGVEGSNGSAILDDSEAAAVPSIAVAVFADDFDLAGCLRLGEPGETEGRKEQE